MTSSDQDHLFHKREGYGRQPQALRGYDANRSYRDELSRTLAQFQNTMKEAIWNRQLQSVDWNRVIRDKRPCAPALRVHYPWCECTQGKGK